MDIIFDGKYDGAEAAENLKSIIRLFEERYHISRFREIHLSVTLMDEDGEDVELVDSDTSEVYRTLQVCRNSQAVNTSKRRHRLSLVVDNTRR
jgi:hypothetical protein